MYSKCYTPVCDEKVSRKAFVNMKAIKEQVELRLKNIEKKVKDLESEFQRAKEDAKKAVEEEQHNKKATIQATIEAENIHF